MNRMTRTAAGADLAARARARRSAVGARLPRTAALAAFLLPALLTLPALASHSVFVTVPGHAEEALTWCGPATGQMVIGGYPASACARDQADVDASIQAHKVESNWDTDPAGLRDAMMELCPPPGGGHWVVSASADATSLMHTAAYWMTRNHYPVAALLSTAAHNSHAPHQEHWVAVKGIVTNVDPTTNPTVNLEYVFFVDPAVPLGDAPLERFVSGATWYAELQAVTKAPSAYTGRFVAVIEPPRAPGRALAKTRVRVGRVIRAAEAVRFAQRFVRELKLAEMETFRGLGRARPLEPLLINAERDGYYLVPFGVPGQPSSLALIVNAYTGEFEEAGRFAPRPFLREGVALERVRAALARERPIEPGEYKAALVAPPEATRYVPEWRVTLAGRTLRVDQLGEVREEKARPTPR